MTRFKHLLACSYSVYCLSHISTNALHYFYEYFALYCDASDILLDTTLWSGTTNKECVNCMEVAPSRLETPHGLYLVKKCLKLIIVNFNETTHASVSINW